MSAQSLKPITRQSFIIGLLSFLVVLFCMPLGHAFVILLGRGLSGTLLNIAAGILGVAGIVLALAGNRLRSEAMQILCGVFGAILFWGAWVEFIYISYGHSIGVFPLIMDGEIYTKPEYLMMPTSIPFAALAFIMYVFMAKTNWGIVLVVRDWLGLKVSDNDSKENLAIRSFIDLLLLIWWCYLILLVEFDPFLLGLHHPVTMIFATICLIGGLILLIRSFTATSWASGLRQAIVTVCVLWTYIEVMIKLKLFTEIWIYPERYVVEMILLVIALIAVLLIIARLGHKNVNNRLRK